MNYDPLEQYKILHSSGKYGVSSEKLLPEIPQTILLLDQISTTTSVSKTSNIS